MKIKNRNSVPVPNSALSIQMIRMLDGTSLEFRKTGPLIIINVCRFCSLIPSTTEMRSEILTIVKRRLNFILYPAKRFLPYAQV
jgi:hypothetical protein